MKISKKTVIGAVAMATMTAFAVPNHAWNPWRPIPPKPAPFRPVPPRPVPPRPPFDVRVQPKEVNLYVFAPTGGVWQVEQSADLVTWQPLTNVVNGAKCFFRVTKVEDNN